jgi:hypothetical protein
LIAKESITIVFGVAASPENARLAEPGDVPTVVWPVPKAPVCAAPEKEALPATTPLLAESVTVTVPAFVAGVPNTAPQISVHRSGLLPTLPQLPAEFPLPLTVIAARQVKVGLVPLQVTLDT